MVTGSGVKTFSILLFKFSSLILAVLLALQLIKEQLPFPYDITRLLSFEQFVFVYAIIVITLLAFVEGRTLQRRVSFNFGVLVLYIIAIIGVYFIALVFGFGYDFDNSTTNSYIGYFLLVGVVMIVINAREELIDLRKSK